MQTVADLQNLCQQWLADNQEAIGSLFAIGQELGEEIHLPGSRHCKQLTQGYPLGDIHLLWWQENGKHKDGLENPKDCERFTKIAVWISPPGEPFYHANSHLVCSVTLSNSPAFQSGTDVFVPGRWTEYVLPFLSQAERKIQLRNATIEDCELRKWQKKLLVGVKV